MEREREGETALGINWVCEREGAEQPGARAAAAKSSICRKSQGRIRKECESQSACQNGFSLRAAREDFFPKEGFTHFII
jgi:hypothetical protein